MWEFRQFTFNCSIQFSNGGVHYQTGLQKKLHMISTTLIALDQPFSK